jgi:predicted porin
MKKTLIALSVLVAAGSVNAANVYDNDGVAVDLYGDFAVHYEKAEGADKEAAIVIDDADFGINFESAMNEQMAIIGNMDVNGEGDSLKLDDLTVGFKADGTTVKVGDQVNLVDDFGLSNDFAFGLKTAEDKVALAADGSQVIRVDYDSGEAFYGAFATTSNADGLDNGVDTEVQYDLNAGVRFDAADVSVTYSTGELTTGADSDFIGVKGSYSLEDITLSAVYTTAEQESADVTAFGANIEYSMDKVGFNFGLVDMDDEVADQDYVEYYANVSYSLAKNATAFFEVQDSDLDNVDMGYAAGVTVKF